MRHLSFILLLSLLILFNSCFTTADPKPPLTPSPTATASSTLVPPTADPKSPLTLSPTATASSTPAPPTAISISTLPAQRPEDFSASLSFNQGMLPFGDGIHLSADHSSYRMSNRGTRLQLNFQVSERSLDQVYQRFLQQQFDQIVMFEEEVTDRGGSSVWVQFGEEKIKVRDMDWDFIEPAWQANFDTIVQEMRRFVQRPGDHEFVIEWDPALDSFGGNLAEISLDLGQTFSGLTGNELETQKIRIWLENPRATYDFKIKYADKSEQIVSLNLAQHQGLKLLLVDDQLQLEMLQR